MGLKLGGDGDGDGAGAGAASRRRWRELATLSYLGQRERVEENSGTYKKFRILLRIQRQFAHSFRQNLQVLTPIKTYGRIISEL